VWGREKSVNNSNKKETLNDCTQKLDHVVCSLDAPPLDYIGADQKQKAGFTRESGPLTISIKGGKR
jgi:hypothetical protein